jgi:hypothetical protein
MGVGNIDLNRKGAPPNGCRDGAGFFMIQVGHRDAAARPRQSVSNHFANPLRRARDDGGLIV